MNNPATPAWWAAVAGACLFTAACGGNQGSAATPEKAPAEPAAATETDTGPGAKSPDGDIEVPHLTSDLQASLDPDTIRAACQHVAEIFEANPCDIDGPHDYPGTFKTCVEAITQAWGEANTVDEYDAIRGSANDCLPAAESCADLAVCFDNMF